MKVLERHTLPIEDQYLFDTMSAQYVSGNEKVFFETLCNLEQWDYSVAHDFLLLGSDNDEHIFLIRVNYNEYLFGFDDLQGNHIYEHVMNLSRALNSNLKQLGILNRDVTLLGWLRERDYKGVSYERNQDYE